VAFLLHDDKPYANETTTLVTKFQVIKQHNVTRLFTGDVSVNCCPGDVLSRSFATVITNGEYISGPVSE